MRINKINLNLVEGFTDQKGKLHSEIEIGNLVKAEQLFTADALYGDENKKITSYHVMRFSISKFGSLDCPVALETILSLDTLDLDNLTDAVDTFTAQNGGNFMSFVDNKTYKLAHPIKKNGINFNLIEFGRLENGYDIANAHNCSGNFQFNAFTAGRRVKTLKQTNGKKVLDTQLDLNDIGQFWVYDAMNLIQLSVNWIEQIRKQRTQN